MITLSLRADGALVIDGLAAEVVIEHFDPTDVIHINGLAGDDVIEATRPRCRQRDSSPSTAATATMC